MCGSILLSDTDTMPQLHVFPFLDLQRTSNSECVCISQRGLEKEIALNISKKYETQNYMHRDVQPYRL